MELDELLKMTDDELVEFVQCMHYNYQLDEELYDEFDWARQHGDILSVWELAVLMLCGDDAHTRYRNRHDWKIVTAVNEGLLDPKDVFQ